MTQSQMTVQQALELAQKHHAAGNLQQAESIYRQILSIQPKNADALHLFGVVALQVGQNEEAIRLINRAIAINPKNADYLCNLGLALMAANRTPEAIGPFQQALAIKSDIPEAYSNLGNALRIVGRFDEAIAACRRAMALRPNLARAATAWAVVSPVAAAPRRSMASSLAMQCQSSSIVCSAATLFIETSSF